MSQNTGWDVISSLGSWENISSIEHSVSWGITFSVFEGLGSDESVTEKESLLEEAANRCFVEVKRELDEDQQDRGVTGTELCPSVDAPIMKRSTYLQQKSSPLATITPPPPTIP